MTKNQTEKLQWRTTFNTDFSKEEDFLTTLLVSNGVKEEELQDFLHPTKKLIHSPFLMENMRNAIQLVREQLSKDNPKILLRVDCDVDGYTSSSIMAQFLQKIFPGIELVYVLDYEKRHGLTIDNMSKFSKDEFDLIIIPDASMTCKDAKYITKNFSAPILVLDHHIIETEYFDGKKWYNDIKDVPEEQENVSVDCYTKYCTAVNCTDGTYPNPHLTGAGVVQKFIEAYLDVYGERDRLPDLREEYLDLVSVGMVSDVADLRNLETRYYVIEGLKPYRFKNEFLNELQERLKEDMKFGRTIITIGFLMGPRINGCIRYGKDKEQFDMFRAMVGEQETIEYQPRRKSRNDPKPPIEYHSLQKTMARIADNVKSRQDTEVRKFVVQLVERIEEENLLKNSVLFIDGTDILTKGTVTGLVANKLATKYFRPVVLMRRKNNFEIGGSYRGYDKGKITNTKEFLQEAGAVGKGHENAGGFNATYENLSKIIEKCNEMLPLSELCTIHTVDWQIPASKLKREYVQEVAENYAIFGNSVPEPKFAITDIKINASQINAYGDNNNFIRFVYNGITFTKKYCSATDFDTMTLKSRSTIGKNKKDLKINVICQFVLNSWEDKVLPEVKILYFDSEEDKGNTTAKSMSEIETVKKVKQDEDWESPTIKKKKKFEDDDFDW